MSTAAWLLMGLFIAFVVLGAILKPRKEPEPLSDEPTPETNEVGTIEIEDAIDLHGFQPREIPKVVESYLEAAVEEGFEEVRLIHGRGKGVQRRAVQELLAKHPLVERFADAPAHRGGWGATIAWLRVKRMR